MSSQQPVRYGYGAPPPDRRGPNKALVAVFVAVAGLILVGGAATAVGMSGSDEGSASARPEQAGTRGINPCDLVAGPDAARLGLGKGEKDSLVPRTCTWDLATPGDTVRVWMQDSIGLAVLPPGGRSLRIGSHDAIRSRGPMVGPLHSCQVAIGVTGTSRVDVVVNSSAGTSLACSVAMRAARLVESNLP